MDSILCFTPVSTSVFVMYFIAERANAILMIWREYHILARFTRELAAIIPGTKTSAREISIAGFDKKMIYVQGVS